MKTNRKQDKITKNKAVLITIGAAIVVGLYVGAAALNGWFPFPAKERTYEPGEQVINLDKSDAEKDAIEELEQNPGSKTDNPQTDTPVTPDVDKQTGKRPAAVLLTNTGIVDGNVSASGFVTNLSESGGSCEYVFTQGAKEVRKNSVTFTNPTSTTCKTVNFPVSELSSSGVWKVQLIYTSSDSQGTSQTKDLKVDA